MTLLAALKHSHESQHEHDSSNRAAFRLACVMLVRVSSKPTRAASFDQKTQYTKTDGMTVRYLFWMPAPLFLASQIWACVKEGTPKWVVSFDVFPKKDTLEKDPFQALGVGFLLE